MIIGYTSGVFDLFHIGHLNLLKKAKGMCDKLIVGVCTDELTIQYKHKKPFVSFENRLEIVQNIRCVDIAIPQESLDKTEVYKKYKFDIILIGDDWFGNERWIQTDSFFSSKGVKVVYLPYTKGISSTYLSQIINGNL